MEPVKARPVLPPSDTAGSAPAPDPAAPLPPVLLVPLFAAELLATVPAAVLVPVACPPLAPGAGAVAKTTPQVGVV